MEKRKRTTPEPKASSTWEQLEEFVREHVQQFIQALLEKEVTELLGRTKSARREAVDATPGYRNGYGKPRHLTLTSGTITVRRPRVRDLNERFVSRVLPLFKRQTKEVGELLPQLYLHGLALGDFELALRGLLGEGADLEDVAGGRIDLPAAQGCGAAPGRVCWSPVCGWGATDTESSAAPSCVNR
jgi:putative transposase